MTVVLECVQPCLHCGSEKTHILASDSSMVICQMCGKLTEIGMKLPNPNPKPINSPKKVSKKNKSNNGGDRGGKMRWSEKEDKLLIKICEDPTLKVSEIHMKYRELKDPCCFARNHRSIKNRVQKLRSLGLINYRYKPYQLFKCPYCGGEFHIVTTKKK